MPAKTVVEYTILPVALRLADGSYLVSSNQALGLWDQITVIPCESAGDPHCAAWALFRKGASGELEKYELVCDDHRIVAAALDSLQANPRG